MKTVKSLARLADVAALAAALFLAAPSQCFALTIIKDVSKDEAKNLGVVIQLSPAGQAGMRVSLEFEPKGKLKNFMRVDLDIRAGGKCLVSAPLLTSKPAPEKVAVSFCTQAENLPRSAFTIVVPETERTRIGYQFALKNFIEPHVGGPVTFALWSEDASLPRDSDKNSFAVKIGWSDPAAHRPDDAAF